MTKLKIAGARCRDRLLVILKLGVFADVARNRQTAAMLASIVAVNH
jgi:hypothetical protein